MSWALFLDDTREPSFLWTLPQGQVFARHVQLDWVVARDFDEAVQLVENFGCPSWIAFDHDLGNASRSGYEFAKWLADAEMDGKIDLEGLCWFVHSQNPVGAENIRKFIELYMEHRA